MAPSNLGQQSLQSLPWMDIEPFLVNLEELLRSLVRFHFFHNLSNKKYGTSLKVLYLFPDNRRILRLQIQSRLIVGGFICCPPAEAAAAWDVEGNCRGAQAIWNDLVELSSRHTQGKQYWSTLNLQSEMIARIALTICLNKRLTDYHSFWL